jgi:hypothetical protein
VGKESIRKGSPFKRNKGKKIKINLNRNKSTNNNVELTHPQAI